MESKQKKIKAAYYFTNENKKFIESGSELVGMTRSSFLNHLIFKFRKQ